MIKKQMLFLLSALSLCHSAKPDIIEALDNRIKEAQIDPIILQYFLDGDQALNLKNFMHENDIYITKLSCIRDSMINESAHDAHALIKCYNACMEQTELVCSDKKEEAFFYGEFNGIQAVEHTVYSILLEHTN